MNGNNFRMRLRLEVEEYRGLEGDGSYFRVDIDREVFVGLGFKR